MSQPKTRKASQDSSPKKRGVKPIDQDPAPGRLIDYDALTPITTASTLLEVVPAHFAARSTGPLSGYGSSLRHNVRFRGVPMVDSFLEQGVVLTSVEFEYEAFDQEKDTAICSVHGAFMTIYGLQRDKIEAPTELIELFAELHGMHHAWPYIRELVGSLVSRLGLSGVLLPVWPPPKRLPPKGEYLSVSMGPG